MYLFPIRALMHCINARTMFRGILFASLWLAVSSCGSSSQSPENQSLPEATELTGPVGGGCDGCDILFVDLPQVILPSDTSPAWNGEGQRLHVSGTVFKAGTNEPAPDVIIYYWQTDAGGHYTPLPDQPEPQRRHGYVRGWVMTGPQGRYDIYTVRPGPLSLIHI